MLGFDEQAEGVAIGLLLLATEGPATAIACGDQLTAFEILRWAEGAALKAANGVAVPMLRAEGCCVAATDRAIGKRPPAAITAAAPPSPSVAVFCAAVEPYKSWVLTPGGTRPRDVECHGPPFLGDRRQRFWAHSFRPEIVTTAAGVFPDSDDLCTGRMEKL